MDNAENMQFNQQREKLETELHSMDSELKSGGDSSKSIYQAEENMLPVEQQMQNLVHTVDEDEHH